MATYTVTAQNSVFYMTLAVEAKTSEQAVKLFQTYLDSQTGQEDEEYEMALDFSEGHDRPDREDFTYDFDADEVAPMDSAEAAAFRYTPSPEVQMISSGGNG
jgi:hypothetical protein